MDQNTLELSVHSLIVCKHIEQSNLIEKQYKIYERTKNITSAPFVYICFQLCLLWCCGSATVICLIDLTLLQLKKNISFLILRNKKKEN